jgi:hypothetical protein
VNDLSIVPLEDGYHAIIDAADAALVLPHRWKLERKPRRDGTWVLHAHAFVPGLGSVSLQAFLLKAPQGMMTDHKNCDGIDCRRCNLRIATRGQNSSNRPKRFCHKGISRFKGVRPQAGGKWCAVLQANHETYGAYGFLTEEDAARAYDELARKRHGEFARLNFPDGDAS